MAADTDSLIRYPSQFPIKVLGPKVDGFVHAVSTVARAFDPDFDAAAITDHALILHATVFAAGTFPVLFRPENPVAE